MDKKAASHGRRSVAGVKSKNQVSKHSIPLLGVLLFQLACSPALAASPELKKVNELCNEVPCEEGLFCVDADNQKKCATCDQSKLDDYSKDIDDRCSKPWTPSKTPAFQDALAADGRVLVDVFDSMIDTAKKCKAAREYREGQCWKGGDEEHVGELKKVSDSLDNLAREKKDRIETKKVYYGSVDTYKSRLTTFTSKCTQDISIDDIKEKIKSLDSDQNDGKKVDCSEIDKSADKLARCFEAANDLLGDGFSGSSDKFPGQYAEILNQADKSRTKAKDLLSTVKSKDLCS